MLCLSAQKTRIPIPAAAAAAMAAHMATGAVSPVMGPFLPPEPELPEEDLVPELLPEDLFLVKDDEPEVFFTMVNPASALPSSKTAVMVCSPTERVSNVPLKTCDFSLPTMPLARAAP